MVRSQRASARHWARQLSIVSLSAVLATATLVPSIAFAGDRRAGGGEPPNDKDLVLPITPAMQVALDKKMLSFQAMAAAVASANVAGGMAASIPSSFILSTYARHQHRWTYCGPATVQVVSNYTWHYYYSSTSAESTATNRYGESYSSSAWTHTDATGQTYLADLINGMNSASVLPFGGFYMQWHNPTWSDFHNAIATDTSTWYMPLAASVNPRPANSIYYLYSWRNAPQNPNYGHYIPLRGYAGFSQSSALAYYNDSSGGQDDFGVGMYGDTGAFQDLSFTVYETIMLKYGNFVW
jgi:hypothetical protein